MSEETIAAIQHSGGGSGTMAEGRPDILRFGSFELDLRSGELRRQGVLLKLQGQPVELLALLAERAGEVVSREEIRNQVWAPGTFVDFDQGINACVRQIRAALGDSADSPRWVQTLPRRGYRFLAPVRAVRVNGGAAEVAERGFTAGQDLAAGGAGGDAAAEILPPPSALSGPLPRPRRMARRIAVAAVLALAIALTVALVDWESTPRAGAAPGSPIVAILPYTNLSGDPSQDYLSDGLTEELITQLSRSYGRRLGVIARTSAMKYRGTGKSAREIAAELRADYVLEGSLRREGDRVRVTSQLIRAADEVHVWAASHERRMRDFLTLQIEVSRQIAGALALQLIPPGEVRAAAATPEAYEEYLQGRRRLRPGSYDPAGARAHLEQAVELDPGFAPAWVALARALRQTGGGSREAGREAREAARKALMIDDALPEAHAVLAEMSLYQDWDVEAARRGWERALELDPGSSEIRHDFAAYWSVTGRHDEALELMREAERLDPLAPAVVSDVGWYAYFARRYDEAIDHSRRTLESSPDYYWAHRCIILAAMVKGEPSAALASALADMRDRGAEAERIAALDSGDPEGALRAYWLWDIDYLRARPPGMPPPPTDLAVAHLALGDRDAALAALEAAVEQRRGWILPFLHVDPFFDPLRGDPRFEALLTRIGIPVRSSRSHPRPRGRRPA